MTKSHKVLGLIALLAAGGLQAAPSLVTDLGALKGNDTVSWAQLGGVGTLLGQSFNANSSNALAVSGTLAGAEGGCLAVVGSASDCSWGAGSGFNVGDSVIWAEGSSSYTGSGPLTLSFKPVQGAGLFVQSVSSGAFTVQIQAFNGNTLLNSFTATSASGAGQFIGVLDDHAEITKIQLSLTQCGPGCDSNDFAVNSLVLNTVSAVPEPSTWALFGLGALALPLLRRRAASTQSSINSKRSA